MRTRSALALLTGLLLGSVVACNTSVMIHDVEADTERNDGTEDNVSVCSGITDGVLVCDPFEEELTIEPQTLNGDIQIVDDPVFEGAGALRAQTTAEQSWAVLRYPFEAINSGTVYLAARMLIPEDTVAGTITLLNLSGYVDEASEQTFGVDINVSAQRSLDIYVHGNFTRYESDAAQVPEGRWFCLDGRYSISDVSGEATVWIDDNLVVSTTASQEAVITGGVSELRIGIGWTENGQEAATVYVDNLVLGTSPVSCDDF